MPKKRGSYEDVVRMKRCFLSGSLPALSPQRSRSVEAVCIHLSQKIPNHGSIQQADGTKRYASRWSLILKKYRKIQARLMNSQLLLEKTGLTFFNINETTLQNWVRNIERTNQIKVLMQGREIPTDRQISATPLPPTRAPTILF